MKQLRAELRPHAGNSVVGGLAMLVRLSRGREGGRHLVAAGLHIGNLARSSQYYRDKPAARSADQSKVDIVVMAVVSLLR
jgi:hypothetical protein